MELHENWVTYLWIILGSAGLVGLNFLAKIGIFLLVRATIPKAEKVLIFERLRVYFNFWENGTVEDIEITDVDFPSPCCGVALLKISPIFHENELPIKTNGAKGAMEVSLCRKCLSYEGKTPQNQAYGHRKKRGTAGK